MAVWYFYLRGKSVNPNKILFIYKCTVYKLKVLNIPNIFVYCGIYTCLLFVVLFV